MRLSSLILMLALCVVPATAHALPENYNAPQGNVSGLMIFDRGGFARIYGTFKSGVARAAYDAQSRTLDNLKIAFLANSFSASSPLAAQQLFTGALDGENEVAFVQSEPVTLESGGKTKIKGELVLNGTRRAVTFDIALNKYARIDQSTNVAEDGAMSLGLSLNGSFKRSDFGAKTDAAASPLHDDAVILMDVVGVK